MDALRERIADYLADPKNASRLRRFYRSYEAEGLLDVLDKIDWPLEMASGLLESSLFLHAVDADQPAARPSHPQPKQEVAHV